MSLTANLPADLAQLAESITASARELHERIMRDIQRQAISHEEAQDLFDKEVALRLQANQIYVEAAALSARQLGLPRQQLLDLAARAREAIRHIERTKLVAGIAASLLRMVSAVAAERPEDLAPAAEELKAQLAGLNANRDA